MKTKNYYLGILCLGLLLSPGNVNMVSGAEDSPHADKDGQFRLSLVDEAQKPVYTIVRGIDSGDTTAFAVTRLTEALSKITGAKFATGTDFTGQAQSVNENAFELIIGNANRNICRHTSNLSAAEYIIRTEGNKILIRGGSERSSLYAVEQFISILQENGGKIPSHLNKQGHMPMGKQLLAITNQGTSSIEVYDVSTGELSANTRIWQHDMPFYNVADVKFRHSKTFGDVALVACGGTSAFMISYPEGKTVWSTSKTANNPHSVELIPNGYIAVAASTGAELRFFNAEKGETDVACAVPFQDAHGVLWDEERQVLWALGRNVLTAFTVKIDGENISVKENTDLRAEAPSDYGHDLAPYYGDTNKLWLTTTKAIYVFDKTTKTFTTEFDGYKAIQREDVKGVGNFKDGSLATIDPDGIFRSWTSRKVLVTYLDSGKYNNMLLDCAIGHFYKCRIWCKDYQ